MNINPVRRVHCASGNQGNGASMHLDKMFENQPEFLTSISGEWTVKSAVLKADQAKIQAFLTDLGSCPVVRDVVENDRC